jgi:hypothetical protein
MIAFILALIPGINTLVTSITTAFFNAKVQITQARIGGDRDVAVKLVQAAAAQDHEDTARLGIIASNKLLTFLLIAMALPLVAFEWKVIVWDKMLGWGSTPELSGQVASWAQSIIYFLFGAPTAVAIGKMWFSRKTS